MPMGKSEGKKEKNCNIYPTETLRENAKGITNLSASINANTLKRMQHLQRLAVWAVGEVSIPPLGALLGAHLAATGEASGIPPPDSPFFMCERCETVLVPGHNCSVRVLKHRHKVRHRPRALSNSVNAVVYFCNFCSHKNMKPGTHKDYVKRITSEAAAFVRQCEPTSKIGVKQTDRRDIKSPLLTSSPFSPKVPTTSASKNASSTTKKRKRKGWSTLKELASSNPHFSNLGALKIPVFNIWGNEDANLFKEK